ncbi:MAG: hypothetical protein ACO1QB_01775 [Verrucomicrobiales bacterium]
MVIAFILFLYGLAHGQALRRARIAMARSALKYALDQYATIGKIDKNGPFTPFIFTNQVIVGGTSYQCIAAAQVPGFEDEGILAMTTNQITLFLDKNRGPKVIPAQGYMPNFFPEHF